MENLFSVSDVDFDDMDSLEPSSQSRVRGSVDIQIGGGGGSIGGSIKI